MAKQSQTCYAAYRRLSTATQLHLLGIQPFIDLYKPFLPGIDNWKIHKEKNIQNYSGKWWVSELIPKKIVPEKFLCRLIQHQK